MMDLTTLHAGRLGAVQGRVQRSLEGLVRLLKLAFLDFFPMAFTAAWALGVGGLFGYHFFYFLALRQAPPLQANLLNYLWPLLIVLFSALLPGERLRARHVLGGLAGMAGAALLVLRGVGQTEFSSEHLAGYAAALTCAVVWGGYSVLSRRFRQVPTEAIGGFCGATAVLALLCHLLFEGAAVIGEQLLGPLALSFQGFQFGHPLAQRCQLMDELRSGLFHIAHSSPQDARGRAVGSSRRLGPRIRCMNVVSHSQACCRGT